MQDADLKNKLSLSEQAGQDLESVYRRNFEKRAELRFRQVDQLNAVKNLVEATAFRAQGKVDQNAKDILAAKYGGEAATAEIKALNDIKDLKVKDAHAAALRAQANHYNTAAAAAKAATPSKADVAAVKAVEDAVKPEITPNRAGTNAAGVVQAAQKLYEVQKNLKDAVASGDESRITQAIVAAQEQAGNILSGGKVTHEQSRLIASTKTFADNATSKIGYFTNNPKQGREFVKNMGILLGDSYQEKLGLVDSTRNKTVNRLLGKGGIAKTPVARDRANNIIETIFGEVSNNDGSRRYNNNPADFNAQGKPLNAPAPAPTTNNIPIVEVKAKPPSAVVERAKAALADPKTPSDQRAAAEAIVKASR